MRSSCRYTLNRHFITDMGLLNTRLFLSKKSMNICLLRLTSVEMIKNRKILKLAGTYFTKEDECKIFLFKIIQNTKKAIDIFYFFLLSFIVVLSFWLYWLIQFLRFSPSPLWSTSYALCIIPFFVKNILDPIVHFIA